MMTYMLICNLYLFFGEVTTKVFDPFLTGWFVFLLLSIKSSLYILDNSPLSNVFFVNIFSHFVAPLFIILILSFLEQKF